MGNEGGTARVLRRSYEDKVIAGVAAGIAKHLGVDPLLIRIAFVVAALGIGGGVLAYLLAWIFIPEESPHEGAPARAPVNEGMRIAVGVGLVALGAIWLIAQFAPIVARAGGAIALIGIGAAIIAYGYRR